MEKRMVFSKRLVYVILLAALLFEYGCVDTDSSVALGREAANSVINKDERELIRGYDPGSYNETVDTDYRGVTPPDSDLVKRLKSAVGALMVPLDGVKDVNDYDPRELLVSCSGTLISENLFLTAGHCCPSNGKFHFTDDDPDMTGYIVRECNKEEMKNRYVSFNYELDKKPEGGLYTFKEIKARPNEIEKYLKGELYKVKRVVENVRVEARPFELLDVDYMILELEANSDGTLPGEKYGYTPLALPEKSEENTDAFPKELSLGIIQHSRYDCSAGGGPKQIGVGKVTEVQYTKYGYEFDEDGNFKLVDTETNELIKLEHSVDTEHVGSGSGMIEASSGKLIGVHTSGKNGEKWNKGMFMEYLIKYSPTLNALVNRSDYAEMSFNRELSDLDKVDQCIGEPKKLCYEDDIYLFDSCGRIQKEIEVCSGQQRCINGRDGSAASCYLSSSEVDIENLQKEFSAEEGNKYILYSGSFKIGKKEKITNAYLYFDFLPIESIYKLSIVVYCPTNGKSQTIKIKDRPSVVSHIKESQFITECNGDTADKEFKLVLRYDKPDSSQYWAEDSWEPAFNKIALKVETTPEEDEQQ